MARSVSIDLIGRDMLSRAMEEASRSVRELQRNLARLNQRINVQVEADTARARQELNRTESEVRRLDGKKADVKVNVDPSMALTGLKAIGVGLAALAAPPLVPAFAAAGLATGALAAVAVPAFGEIKTAIQAQTQAQQQSAAAGAQAQSRALALAGAQQQVASAVRQAAQAHRQALEQVRTAEQQLTQAQQSATQAQRDLNAARAQARRQLQDMANNVADAKLSERQAVLDAADAQTNYNKVLADPKATAADKARAKLQVDQARQAVKERHQALARAIADEKAAQKAGVEGSDAVTAARDRLAQADQRVRDAERQVAQARANVARADAQSADAVASARRGLAAASLQGAGANAALNASMAALSPAQRTLMAQLLDLKAAFDQWRHSLEPTVLPVFGKGIAIIKSQLPGLAPLVRASAGAFSGLLDDVAAGARSPFWAQFRKQMTSLAPKAITGLGKATEDIVAGVLHLVSALVPAAPTMLRVVQQIAAGFRSWATSVPKSSGFQGLINYIRTNGPVIAQTLAQVGGALAHVAASLAPLAGSVGIGALSTIGLLAKILNGLPPSVIQDIAMGIVAVRVATTAWSIAQVALNVAMDANPIGLIVVAIGALIAGLVLAYRHSETFRRIVQFAWRSIQQATALAWSLIRPIFRAIANWVSQTLVPKLREFWQVNKRVWAAIWDGVRVAWGYIRPVWVVIRAWLGTTLKRAFGDALGAARLAWRGIETIVSVVWTRSLKPGFSLLRSTVAKIADAFSAAVSGIKIAWSKLKDIARVPVNFVIGVYNKGLVPLVNGIAGLVGLPKDKRLHQIKPFATGGIYPGYTPGRDIGLAAVSGGEAIMRPEWTRAVGPDFVHAANRQARTGGVAAVRRWLTGSHALGGEGLAFSRGGVVPPLVGAFAGGGIVGDFVRGMKNFVFGDIGKAAKGLLNKLLGGAVPGTGFLRDVIAGIPGWIKKAVLDFVTGKAGGGVGGKGLRAALNWARAQVGKPYIWGGVGPGGYDCSGFMSAIWNVIRGKSPYSRRFTTFSFTGARNGPAGFVRDLMSGFRVGVTNAGVGHMAGTLLGVNVESSGSRGVHMGTGARGANDGLFGLRYGLKADTGALMLRPGWNPPVFNGTGAPEYLETPRRGGVTQNFGPIIVQERSDVDMLMNQAEFKAKAASF